MQVIDAQLHEPAIALEWPALDQAMRWRVLLEVQLAYMRAVGVDRALLLPAEPDWGRWACQVMPERFAMVSMVGNPAYGCIDPRDPRIDELIAAERASGDVVAIRVIAGGDIDACMPAIAACARAHMPIFLSATGNLEAVAAVAKRFPEMTIILDHMGLPQFPGETPDQPPFRALPQVLELAAFPNVAVKLTSLVSLSGQVYPFADVWPPLQALLKAFGAQGLMWGSDISRFVGRIGFDMRMPGVDTSYKPNHSYAEALLYLRECEEISLEDREWILGRTVQRLLGWPVGYET